MNYANPNPRRIEIRLDRTPRWFALATVLLCMVVLTSCIWLFFKEVPSPLPTWKAPKLPNVSVMAQRAVDDTVKKAIPEAQ